MAEPSLEPDIEPSVEPNIESIVLSGDAGALDDPDRGHRAAGPCPAAETEPVLRLLHHYVYAYGKGVRALCLMTISRREMELVRNRLKTRGIDHFVQSVNRLKANVFFGHPAFVAVARSLVTRPLNELTAEEDFMLGTLLGYDCEQQCRRFLKRSGQDELA